MPNWCNNTLNVSTIEKHAAELKEFVKKAKSRKLKTDLSLNKLLPLPKELEGTTAPSPKPSPRLIKKYGADNWYDWQVKKWGTKWDVEAEIVWQEKTEIEYSFDSAWGPPCDFIIHVSKLFPHLLFTLEYDEPGMLFAGKYIAKNNAILEDWEYTPQYCSECGNLQPENYPTLDKKGRCENCRPKKK